MHALHAWRIRPCIIMIPNSNYCFYELCFRGAIRLSKMFFMIAHKFSIGFRSGELPGLSETINLAFLKKVSIFFDMWQGALSCYTILFPSGNDCCIDGN